MNALLKGLVSASGLLALVALGTPSSALAASPPKKAPPAVRATRSVTVSNTRSVPVTVYLEHGDMDTRLGTVSADSRAVLSLPKYLEGEDAARIVVHPKVGLDLSSQDIVVPRQGTLKVLVPVNNTGYMPRSKVLMPGIDPNATTLTVENPRNEPVDVYIQREMFDTRIGTVSSGQVRTFDLPKWLTREPRSVQVVMHPRRGFDLASQSIDLTPRSHLEVKVPLNG